MILKFGVRLLVHWGIGSGRHRLLQEEAFKIAKYLHNQYRCLLGEHFLRYRTILNMFGCSGSFRYTDLVNPMGSPRLQMQMTRRPKGP